MLIQPKLTQEALIIWLEIMFREHKQFVCGSTRSLSPNMRLFESIVSFLFILGRLGVIKIRALHAFA